MTNKYVIDSIHFLCELFLRFYRSIMIKTFILNTFVLTVKFLFLLSVFLSDVSYVVLEPFVSFILQGLSLTHFMLFCQRKILLLHLQFFLTFDSAHHGWSFPFELLITHLSHRLLPFEIIVWFLSHGKLSRWLCSLHASV